MILSFKLFFKVILAIIVKNENNVNVKYPAISEATFEIWTLIWLLISLFCGRLLILTNFRKSVDNRI